MAKNRLFMEYLHNVHSVCRLIFMDMAVYRRQTFLRTVKLLLVVCMLLALYGTGWFTTTFISNREHQRLRDLKEEHVNQPDIKYEPVHQKEPPYHTPASQIWVDKVPENGTKEISSKRPKYILLVTYMRGGSSFLGDIFNNDPDVFYWFEPLLELFVELQKNSGGNWFVNGDLSMKNFSDTNKGKMFNIFTDIFHCNINRLPSDVLAQVFTRKSKKLKEYHTCFQRQKAKSCVSKAVKACNASPIRVIKTVRMRLDLVHEFISLYPEVDIVFLLRSPHGILNSRWESCKNRQKLNYKRDTDIVCRQMEYDSNMTDHFFELHSEKATFLKYEDLATSAIASAKSLYSSLRIGKLPRQVESWINASTHANQNDGALGTNRKNSGLTSQQWKSNMAKDNRDYITDKCSRVIKNYGYDV